MRRDALMHLATIIGGMPGVSPLPLGRRAALSRRLSVSTCEFYGYVDGNHGAFNEYVVEMAGRGNEGSSNSCMAGVASYIQAQCQTMPRNFSCTPGHENLRDAHIGFRINKATLAQPDCVTEALRLASSIRQDEQNIQCFCLAECWTADMEV